MAAKKTETKPRRRSMTIERAKEFLKKHAPTRARRRSSAMTTRKGFFGLSTLGPHGDVGQLATWGIGGAVVLASYFTFPSWLSPLGVALFLYGWWRGNAQIKSVGALLVVVQFVQSLGVVKVASEKLAEIKAKGLKGALSSGSEGAGAGGAPTPEQVAAAAAKGK